MKKTKKLLEDFQEYNRLMKRCGSNQKTLDEYIAYRSGKRRPRIKGRKKAAHEATTMIRKSPEVPSMEDSGVFKANRTVKVYTGKEIMGIATMHKSNAVPVRRHEDAEDIAKMRRN